MKGDRLGLESMKAVFLMLTLSVYTTVPILSLGAHCHAAASVSRPNAKSQQSYERLIARNAALPDSKALSKKLSQGKPLLWLFLGDSITHGAAHTRGSRDYVDHCEEVIRWELKKPQRIRDLVVNAGISGDTIARYFSEKSTRLLPDNAHIVLINFGVNDVRSRVSEEKFADDLRTLVKQVRRGRAIPVLQVPSPVKGMKARDWLFRDKICELADELNCLLVDHPLYWQEYSKAEAYIPAWMNDALHPNMYGHRAMAQAIIKALQIDALNGATMRLPLK